jgi:hypothetical protein
LPLEARHWEGGTISQPVKGELISKSVDTGENMGESVEIEVAGLAKWKVQDLQNQHTGEK